MGVINGKSRLHGAVIGALLASAALPAAAQQAGQVLTEQDYARAEAFLGNNTGPLLDHAVNTVIWQDDGHFWYRDHDASGDHFMRMDVASGKASQAFDHDKLAAALAKVTGKDIDAAKLPVSGIEIADDGRLDIALGRQHYLCDLQDKQACVAASGVETQLTTDGVEDYGYATDNAGWTHSDRAILVWSPDSSKIATFQQDQRKTSEMVLVGTNVGAPKVERWKYPFVGDDNVTMIERVVIVTCSSPTSGYFQVSTTGWPTLVDTSVMLPVRRGSCWNVAIFVESGDHTRIGRSLWVQPALSVA